MAGSRDATSKLKVGRTREYPMGMDTELIAIGGEPVSLFVLCGERFEDARLLRSGDFSVHMIRVKGEPVSMASCMVGDHQWILARDSFVARFDARVFVFGLPGFFYGLMLPHVDGGDESERKHGTLPEIFARFCAYQDLSAAPGVDEASDTNQDTTPWVRAHSRMEALKLRDDWKATTISAAQATSTAHATGGDQTSSARKMECAVRTSAVVKLLGRSLLTGALQPSRHLNISLGNAGTNAALPSMWIVSDLLDAIETSRAAAPGREAPRGQDGLGCWCLNVEGVMVLLRVIKAVKGRTSATAAGEKRQRDEEGSEHDGLKGGTVGGQGMGFGSGVSRRWRGGRQSKMGNTVGACRSS